MTKIRKVSTAIAAVGAVIHRGTNLPSGNVAASRGKPGKMSGSKAAKVKESSTITMPAVGSHRLGGCRVKPTKATTTTAGASAIAMGAISLARTTASLSGMKQACHLRDFTRKAIPRPRQ